MKKALVIIVSIIGALLIVGGIAFALISNTAKDAAASLTYANVDMSQTKDGTFVGEADAGVVLVKVSVTVENHAIVHIEIVEHQNGRGGAAEAITGDMINANSYDVDTISGATLSSKAIKSAVSQALMASCSD